VQERKRRKTIRLPQSKIDRAVAILGTRTETQAIEQALDLVAGNAPLKHSIRETRPDAQLQSS
jgi:hypothetical protein